MDLSETLKTQWSLNPTWLIDNGNDSNLNITMLESTDRKKHEWFFKGFKNYLADKHSDIQLNSNNFTFPYNFIYGTQHYDTALNSNYGQLKNSQKALNIFPTRDENSNLFVGLFSFSKPFLAQNYVGNLDEQICSKLFESLVYTNNLNKDEWTFQASLHQNTSIFHVHFRMYQNKGLSHYRKVNFNVRSIKQTKDNVIAFIKKQSALNNELHPKAFKLQQAYIKFASQTTLNMNITNEMLDLATCTATTFNDLWKQWIINLSTLNPIHNLRFKKFQDNLNHSLISIKENWFNNLKLELDTNQIDVATYNTKVKKIDLKLKEMHMQFINTWKNNWVFFMVEQVLKLLKSNINNVCSDYENLIHSQQNYHTLKKEDKVLTYSEFAKIPLPFRTRYHKAVLYLTSNFIYDKLDYDDKNMYELLNHLNQDYSLNNIDNLVNELNKISELELDWQAIKNLSIKLKR